MADFEKELGCAPPLLNADLKNLCNKTFNVSDTRDTEVKAMFAPLFFHNKEFKCKTPCTKTVYSSRLMHTSPTKWQDQMALIVDFDKKLDVTHSAFSISEQTLLVRQVRLILYQRSLFCQVGWVSQHWTNSSVDSYLLPCCVKGMKINKCNIHFYRRQ